MTDKNHKPEKRYGDTDTPIGISSTLTSGFPSGDVERHPSSIKNVELCREALADTFNLSEKIEEVRRFFSKEHGVWNDEIIDKIEEDVKTFIKKLKEVIDIIYGINLENAINSNVSEKLRKEVLSLIKGCGEEIKLQLDTLAGEDLK